MKTFNMPPVNKNRLPLSIHLLNDANFRRKVYSYIPSRHIKDISFPN